MRCLNQTEMEEAILKREVDDLKQHLDRCPRCQQLHDKCLSDQQMWKDALFMDKGLPDEFTMSVMHALDGVSVEPLPDELEVTGRLRRRSFFGKKGWISVASVLLVCGLLLLYAQPTIANLVRTLFTADSTTDIGLLEAQQLGVVQNPKVKVSNKGFTLEINEVVVDATRLVLAIKLTDQEGRPLTDMLGDWSKLKVTDRNGKEVAWLRSMGGSPNFDKLTYIFPKEVPTDILIVEGQFDEIGNSLKNIPYTKGDWSFRFEVDMTKANELKLTDLLNEQYTTPDGLHIEMEKLVRTSSGVRLELNTSLNGEAAQLSLGDLMEKQFLSYHFEDEQGNEISSVNSQKVPHTDSMIAQSFYVDEQTGHLHWTFTFLYLPYDRQTIRFVLDGYSIPVASESSVTFHPTDLASSPLIFRDQGDAIKLLDMKVDQDPGSQQPEKVGIIEIYARYTNMVRWDEWVARDEQGHEYNVSFRGGYSGGEIKEAGGDASYILQGMTELPEQVTLIRKVTDRLYTNVKWSFELPKGKKFDMAKDE
jgi:hypothetical protein